MRVTEERVQRRIFGLKGDEIVGGWRKLYDKGLYNLCPSPNVIRETKPRMMRWEEHAVRMKKRNAYRILVGKPEGKIPLGRHKCRWGDNIKMELREIGWGDVDWIHVDQDRDSGGLS
jgi:hypothetical protein